MTGGNSCQDIMLSPEAIIQYFRQAVIRGKPWYPALLEAVGMWTAATEDVDGCLYNYLIAGEAFDWLRLAERLGEAARDLLPADELEGLLFRGKPPRDISLEEFRGFIGAGKYRQYLNFFYGVIVEEALVQTIQEEVRKERWLLGFTRSGDVGGEVYRRIYGETHPVLFRQFRRERNYPEVDTASLTQLKEFTYWRFKYRLEHCDKARVASDTKKALGWLRGRGSFYVSL